MKFICKILVLIFIFVFFTGCTSNGLEELENRVSYLESQLGISYVEPTEVPKNNYITSLEDVFKSYSYSSTFIGSNYPYGCYELNDKSQYGYAIGGWLLYQYSYNNVISHISAVKRVETCYENYSTIYNYLNVGLVEINNELDAKNIFTSKTSEYTKNQPLDVYTIINENTVVCLHNYSKNIHTTAICEIDESGKCIEDPNAKYINMRSIFIIYRDSTNLFYIDAEWEIGGFEDYTNIIIDSCKAVNITNINEIENLLRQE